MKIVNGKKFLKNISMMIGIIILSLIFINSISFSHTETDYKDVYVSNGDTLWNIAKEEKQTNAYFENKDIRDIVSIIKTNNHLSTSDLKIGQKLNIPTI